MSLTAADVSWQFARALDGAARGYKAEFVVAQAGLPEGESPLDHGEDFCDRRAAIKKCVTYGPGAVVDCYLHERGPYGCLAGNKMFTITDERKPKSQPRPVREAGVERKPWQNRYCGPFVLGYITGNDSNWAAKLFRELSGRTSIKSVSDWLMSRALRRVTRVVQHVGYRRSEQPTMAQFLREWPGGMAVVIVGNHFAVVNGSKVYDNGSMADPKGVTARQFKQRRARVKQYWKIDQ